jgi:DMSO/TMAO reductase YedYZ molybdopterin-dependent catalytic subunit
MRVRLSGERCACICVWLGLLAAIGAGSVARGQAQTASAQLTVTGDVEKPLSLSLQDLQQLPRTTVKVTNEHQGNKEEVYEGVLLSTLLKQAGLPQGAQLRGPAMAKYILAEGLDGYRAVFALAELDSSFQDSEIIVADKLDGSPLGEKVGPLRLVAPHDKRPGRWVRMLRSIKVVSVSG